MLILKRKEIIKPLQLCLGVHAFCSKLIKNVNCLFKVNLLLLNVFLNSYHVE